jgi:cytochrome b561
MVVYHHYVLLVSMVHTPVSSCLASYTQALPVKLLPYLLYAPHLLHKFVDMIVPDGWHTTVVSLLYFEYKHLPCCAFC